MTREEYESYFTLKYGELNLAWVEFHRIQNRIMTDDDCVMFIKYQRILLREDPDVYYYGQNYLRSGT